jgi:hypothetical protein
MQYYKYYAFRLDPTFIFLMDFKWFYFRSGNDDDDETISRNYNIDSLKINIK